VRELVPSPGVFCARVGGDAVLMDLVADSYLLLPPESGQMWDALRGGCDQEGLVELARGWLPDDGRARALVSEQLDLWREAGLVCAQVPACLPVPREAGSPSPRTLSRERLASTPLALRSLVRLLRSTLWVRWGLPRRGLPSLLHELQALPAGAGDEATLYSFVRAWQLLRRPYHQGQPDCLPRSLVLAHALRSAGLDAQVCFGAQRFPFLAHAWVEVGGCALDDAPAALAAFTVLARF
jgi:hypothetical protein